MGLVANGWWCGGEGLLWRGDPTSNTSDVTNVKSTETNHDNNDSESDTSDEDDAIDVFEYQNHLSGHYYSVARWLTPSVC